MKKGKIPSIAVCILLLLCVVISRFMFRAQEHVYSENVANVPAFSGTPHVIIGDNVPEFTPEDYTTSSYEYYSPLDNLGRCGYVMACIGQDLMPTEDREGIGQIKPSGWHTVKYDHVDGKFLYNRCHLIGFQLTGENANERNLITGTRYMNNEGMLPFEDLVADYVRDTANHVLYRVTPVFDGDALVARGVQMEGWSVEDEGEGICFNVYVYNAQPGVTIDYATGESFLTDSPETEATQQGSVTYILNVSSKKFHSTDCSNGQSIKEENMQTFTGNRDSLLEKGYVPAGCCDP